MLLVWGSSSHAADVDIGAGISFIDRSSGNGFDSGWDVQLGYELAHSRALNMGAQLHLTRGTKSGSSMSTGDEMNYSSNALYLTARPHNWWLQFKGGAVQADFSSASGENSHTGYGVGMGIVVDFYGVNMHILDYQRFVFGNESFNLYTISFSVMN